MVARVKCREAICGRRLHERHNRGSRKTDPAPRMLSYERSATAIHMLCSYFFGRILPLLPTPSATHPAMRQSPPSGVIGPAILPKR